MIKEFFSFLRQQWQKMNVWIKPDPADHLLLQAVKLFYKSIVVLVMLALSPVVLIVLLFVFFAAI